MKEVVVTTGGFQVDLSLLLFLRDNVEPGARVLEIGSGAASTPYLSYHYDLYSVENDPAYLGLYNSTYIYAPLDKKTGWYKTSALVGDVLPTGYAAILIDGPVERENRMGFRENLYLFECNCLLVFDDVHRRPDYDAMVAVSEAVGREFEIHGPAEHPFAVIRGVTHG